MRDRAFVFLGGLLCLAPAPAIAGVTVFSNSGGGFSQFRPSFFERELFQIQIAGGGQLETVTIAPNHTDFFGGATPRSENGFVYIYADFAGTPDANNDLQPDQLLFEAAFTTSVLPGNTSEMLTIDGTAAGVLLPANATLWIGLEFDGGFSSLASTEEIGNIPDTGMVFERGFGFTESVIGGFPEGDQAPIFDITVVPAPGAFAAFGVGALLAARRRRH